MANAVLVVDMLRGFLEEGHPLYCGDESRKIIPNVKQLIEEEAGKWSRIIYICDNHAPDDLEFQVFPPHCIRGTDEALVIPEIEAYQGLMVPKTRYSGFFGTDLEGTLREIKPEKVIVCGVCTDICVMHTVSDARNRDYAVEVPEDCVASFNAEAHASALGHIRNILGAKVV